MPQYEFSVSLKVVHPEMKASFISNQLSMEPDEYSDVGAVRVLKNGRILGGVYESTIWTNSLTGGNIDAKEILFEDFLSIQNSKLSVHRSFFNDVLNTGGVIEYIVGWFSSDSINMNCVLAPELMQKTSDLGISIVMCTYPENE